MASACRYDFAPIIGSEDTPEGYLRVWCKAARTGTQLYRRADGSQVREYRPPEEIGNPESLSTFGMTPVTWTHPPELLDSANTKQFQIGYSGSQVRYNDGFVEVALTVTDKDSIEKIKRGDATEVSAGYKVDFDPTPGITPEGESYDGVQRNIQVNHIAVVPRGRAGPEVRLLLDRMDAADAVSAPSEETAFQSVPPLTTGSPMATVNLDGLEIDLPTEAASAVQSYVRDAERRIDSAISDHDALVERIQELEAEVSDLTEAREVAEGRADSLESRIDSEEGTSRLDQAQIDTLVLKRLNTLQRLAPAFDENFKFDGIEDDVLYAAAYENLTGEPVAEDADASYIYGVVDGLLASVQYDADEEEEGEEEEEEETPEDKAKESKGMKKFWDKKKAKKDTERGDSTHELRVALGGAHSGSSNPVADYHARQQNAWKKPLTATKGAL